MTVSAFVPALSVGAAGILAGRGASPFASRALRSVGRVAVPRHSSPAVVRPGSGALRALATPATAGPVAPGAALDLGASAMTLVDGKPAPIALRDVFAGKKVVLFSIPGALTPTCSDAQAPEFVAAAEQFKAKGVDAIACLTVNDPFVVDVMRKKVDPDGAITFLADGDASIAQSLGITFDTGAFGGVRARRGSYIVNDGTLTHVNLEDGGAFIGPGSATTVLTQL